LPVAPPAIEQAREVTRRSVAHAPESADDAPAAQQEVTEGAGGPHMPMFVGEQHGRAREAVDFYVSIFPDGHMDSVETYGPDGDR
jgi:hypothetical protein